MTAYGERIARVEVEVKELKREFQEHKSQTEKSFSEVKDQLNQLLALRNKGAGVLWLLGGFVSTGILTAMAQIFGWFKG